MEKREKTLENLIRNEKILYFKIGFQHLALKFINLVLSWVLPTIN